MSFEQLNNTEILLLSAIAIGAIMYAISRYRSRERKNLSPATMLPSPVTVKQEEVSDPLQEVADMLDVSLWYIKQRLHIPLVGKCSARTIEEANDAFDNAEAGSEEEYFAMLKIIELEDDIDNLSGLQEDTEQYPHLRQLLIAKTDMLLMQQVKAAVSEDELLEAYEYAYSETPSEDLLIQKLYEIYKK